jgi:hypothetical protein
MQAFGGALLLAAALSLGVAGCDRGSGGNPNAQGSPGTGNAREVRVPSAPDTAPGGPSGVKGSVAHPGSSGGDAVPGTTGSGTQGAATGPGTPASGGRIAEGSTNSTSSGAVGQR